MRENKTNALMGRTGENWLRHDLNYRTPANGRNQSSERKYCSERDEEEDMLLERMTIGENIGDSKEGEAFARLACSIGSPLKKGPKW